MPQTTAHAAPSAPARAAAHPAARERLRGIASMIAAVFVFSIMDALMKRLSTHYGPLQIACLRCVASFVCLLPVIGWQRGCPSLRVRSPLLHLVRALLGVAMLASFVYAVHRLSMAQTYSLFLAAPLLMTALSVVLQNEHVTRRRWLAIGAGLGGVLIVLEPWSSGAFSARAAAAAAIATVCYSVSALSVRALGREDSRLSLVFWYLLLVGAGAGALSIGDWRAILPGDWLWLAAIGVSGTLGQLWLTDAFRHAPPAVVGPFEYTALLWAFAIDWTFWSATPSASLLVGGAIVIGSGILVILDERRAAEPPLNPACPPP